MEGLNPGSDSMYQLFGEVFVSVTSLLACYLLRKGIPDQRVSAKSFILIYFLYIMFYFLLKNPCYLINYYTSISIYYMYLHVNICMYISGTCMCVCVSIYVGINIICCLFSYIPSPHLDSRMGPGI